MSYLLFRLCDSYDALPNTSSKQTTPTALYNPSFASLNSQQLIGNGLCNENSSIYKCSSDCCSVERQRHNHNSQHSHFNHNNNNNNNNNNNANSNKHRKQKTSKQQQQQQLHHHLRQSNNNNSNKLPPQKQSPQEPEYHNHTIVNTPSDPNLVNYEYIGEPNGIEDDGCMVQTDVMGQNAISENDEDDVTTEHDEDDEEEEEDPINSYSCDDTITDDIVLAGSNHIDRRNNKANKYFITENGINPAAGGGNGHCEHTNGSGGSRGSGSGGDTCCSCSDVSCVYEEPPNHPPLPTNKNQMLRIGEDN